jgi:hypothetical protein
MGTCASGHVTDRRDCPRRKPETCMALADAQGMSLRDWFAGQALMGIMANPERWKQIADDYRLGEKYYDQCSAANAAKAYSLADAMLAAREAKP